MSLGHGEYRCPTTAEPSGLWIVIPAFNERATIAPVVKSLREAGYDHICVVDDGSLDETGDIARRTGAHVLRHVVNLGQGAALQTGISYALAQGAEYICTFDGDGQHSADSVADLVRVVAQEGVDVALGSRFLAPTTCIPYGRRLLLKCALAFTKIHSGLRVTDTHNGLRALTRRAAESIRIEQPGMAHASEILQKIKMRRLSYREVSVKIEYSAYSRAKGQSGLDSIKIVLDLLYHSIALRP